MANIVVEHLVQQAENLPLSDYLELIEQLVHRLRDDSIRNRYSMIGKSCMDAEKDYGLRTNPADLP